MRLESLQALNLFGTEAETRFDRLTYMAAEYFGVPLAGLGLLQWARRRPLAAGVLLGAATATKLYPVLFLVPLLALCLRADRLRAFATVAVATVLTPVLLSLPVYLTSPSFADVAGVQTVVAASPLDLSTSLTRPSFPSG